MIEEIKIAQELNKICNDVVLGCLRCQVKTQEKNLYLWEEVEVVCNKLVSQLTIEQLSKLPKIQKTREIYKKLGKDPSRYRVSSEALVRRILQGKDLYSINNVVNINNLASLNSLYPIGSYDLNKLTSPITFRLGTQGENYKGVGKQIVSLENFPVFADDIGPFGSPITDSERAIITLETTSLLMIVISFCGEQDIATTLNYARESLERYAGAEQIETKILKH